MTINRYCYKKYLYYNKGLHATVIVITNYYNNGCYYNSGCDK